jgi:hypothetical protein
MPSRISLILDVGQLLLDIGGIVDPTPASDTVSGLISVFRGRWVDAGVSAVSLIPFIGDLAKLGKLKRYVNTIVQAVKVAEKDSAFAGQLSVCSDSSRRCLTSYLGIKFRTWPRTL